MTELATAPLESLPVNPELNQEAQRDITAMSNAELLGEAHDFNLRYQDRNYFPSEEKQEFLKSIAHSIEMNDQGALGYSLRGEKLRSAEARTFLDNVINMEREAADPAYERKTHGTMEPEVAEAALDDFKEYIQAEYALGPKIKRKTAEAAAKAVYTAQYLGKAALMTTVAIAQTGAKAAVQGGKAAVEVSKFAGKQSKRAVKATADVLMEPSVPDPSWLDFVREADAAELEASSQSAEPSGIPEETQDMEREESKQKSKARKLGRTALMAALLAGASYSRRRRGKRNVS